MFYVDWRLSIFYKYQDFATRRQTNVKEIGSDIVSHPTYHRTVKIPQL